MSPNERRTALLAGSPALHSRRHGPIAAAILDEALAAVDPIALVRHAVTLDDTGLTVGAHRQPLRDTSRLWCVSVGKAAVPMADALASRLGSRLSGGVVVTKHPAPSGQLSVHQGAHPIPDHRSEQAARAVIDVASAAGPDDVVLVLLSGGASSLMVAPRPGLDLEQLRALGRDLVQCGASIEQINAVRARLDALKGGGLARLAAPATMLTLVLDDVVDAPLHVVGSGPTLPLPNDAPDPLDVLERHGITPSPAIRAALLTKLPKNEVPPGLALRLASNQTAVEAATATAAALGWEPRPLPRLRGEARAWGRQLAARLRAEHPARPTAFIGGGETTVTVRGRGRGGRNQELALAAMIDLDGLDRDHCIVVTLATDGEDGPTDAAGAVVDGDSLARARQAGLEARDHLEDNDAYTVFDRLEDLLRIGPTATNVCDLVLALVHP